jgi:hypothetical protein
MTKFTLKSTVVAVGILAAGAASASVNLDTGVTTGTFAKELNYSSTAPGVAIAAGQTITTKLGFGVSGSQDRYIRVDLGGAKLAAAAAGTNVVNSVAFANSTVVQGGAAGDSYVIYQITAAPAGHAQTETVTITLPSINVTNGNASSVTGTYALYETAVAAVNNAAGTSLYSNNGALLKFASGLAWSLTTNNTTASVEKSFKEFTAATTTGATPVTANTKTARIGYINYDVATPVLNTAGVQVTLANLVTAATKAVFTGDFGAVGAVGMSTDDCGTIAIDLTGALNTAKNSTEVVLGTTAANWALCYEVNGTDSVPAQTINAALDVTAATAATTQDVAAAAIGTIDRDGTELQAPFVTIHPDYLSRMVLTSQHTADAAVEFSVIAEDGVTCTGLVSAATLKAGKQLILNAKDICPALSTGTRFAIKAIIAAPNNKISGVYNVMNYDMTTGKTNSLISYPLLRPGTN